MSHKNPNINNIPVAALRYLHLALCNFLTFDVVLFFSSTLLMTNNATYTITYIEIPMPMATTKDECASTKFITTHWGCCSETSTGFAALQSVQHRLSPVQRVIACVWHIDFTSSVDMFVSGPDTQPANILHIRRRSRS